MPADLFFVNLGPSGVVIIKPYLAISCPHGEIGGGVNAANEDAINDSNRGERENEAGIEIEVRSDWK